MRRLLLCVIGVAALAACGSTAPPSAAPQPSAASPAATATSPSSAAAVPEALAFSAQRVGGGTVDLSAYAGQPVLLWFWAPT